MTFPQLLRKSRLSAGLSQKELAELSGESQTAISAIENGRRGISVAHAEKLLRAMGYELTYQTNRFKIMKYTVFYRTSGSPSVWSDWHELSDHDSEEAAELAALEEENEHFSENADHPQNRIETKVLPFGEQP